MWVSNVLDRYNVVLMLQLLCCLPENMVHVRAHYICKVVKEKNEDKVWKWILPYKDPCRCTKVRYGGWEVCPPKRSFKPVYFDKPLIGDKISDIRDHYGLNCIDLTCPINGSVEGNTDPGAATGLVTWETRAVGNDGNSLGVVCNPHLDFKFPIGRTYVTCIAEDGKGNNKSCTFEVAVIGTSSCQEGWIIFGDQCYLEGNTVVSWDEAEQVCQSHGGHLASIHSLEEDKFIYDIFGNTTFWIGFTDVSIEGTFVWTDGSEINYTNWFPKQPNNNREEDCTMIGNFPGYIPAYTWNDSSCEKTRSYVCKKLAN